MASKKLLVFLIVLVLALFGTNAFLFYKYRLAQTNLDAAKQVIATRTVNAKILNFMNMFIDKVLKAQGEVSFNDRLTLENAVRDLNDPQILDDWNAFVNSKTEPDAQGAVKNLLSDLAKKIKLM